ncbi:MAG: hypothetical protein UV28_C0041G0001 [Candidatus Collierbacteria bacterium GW2011_GWE2_42_48]|nr:MAG: hypothetical protein UV28_C0041G0001 [Candidatus Collierbacteria bacterium GW2011_GWE2_42_48]
MDNSDFLSLQQTLETNPLWYQNDRIKYLVSLFEKKQLSKMERSEKSEFKRLLKQSLFYIGENGYNWDQWRLPTDCVVIHHTSSSPTISVKELNVLGLRLYIKQYLNDEDVINKPLYSGHYWFGKPATKDNMCFVSYHFLIRPNGKIIQLTDTDAYLWHAGNLEVNRKSISIALAGKFINKEPTEEAMQALSGLIKTLSIKKERIYGHNEVINKELLGETECPGNLFENNWKEKILKNV